MGKVQLVTVTKGVGKYENLNTEEIISAIARHGIIKEDNGKLVRYLMDNSHWSPLDMVDFGFEVETSRAIARQWLRHASIKPQEHSQRYSDKVEFEDIELRLEHPTNRQSSTDIVGFLSYTDNFFVGDDLDFREFSLEGLDILQKIEDYYNRGIEKGIAKECMRMFLPECTTTTLTFKGSLRSWLSFLNVRCDHHAQKEIVELALIVGETLEKEMPNVFASIDWRNGMFM